MSLRPRLETKKPFKKRLIRWVIWVILLVLAAATAALVHWNNQMAQSREQLPDLKSKILTFWEWEKDKVDLINNTAKIYSQKNKLLPDQPLPPSIFYEKDKSFWHFLSKNEPVQIVNSYKGKTQYLQADAFTLLVVSDKVPPAGSPYSAVAIVTSPEIIPGGFEVYPPTAPAYKMIHQANNYLEENKAKERQEVKE